MSTKYLIASAEPYEDEEEALYDLEQLLLLHALPAEKFIVVKLDHLDS